MLIYKSVEVNGYGRTVFTGRPSYAPGLGGSQLTAQMTQEVLGARNDHFTEIVYLINVHSEMIYKVS